MDRSRLRIYRLDDLSSSSSSKTNGGGGWTYSELSQVEISSRTDHPPSSSNSDEDDATVADLKRWVDEKTDILPRDQIYFHCTGPVYDNDDNSKKPYRYKFEKAIELNEKDDMSLRDAIEAFYEQNQLTKSLYGKKWIGVRRLVQQQQRCVDDEDDEANVEPPPKKRRR